VRCRHPPFLFSSHAPPPHTHTWGPCAHRCLRVLWAAPWTRGAPAEACCDEWVRVCSSLTVQFDYFPTPVILGMSRTRGPRNGMAEVAPGNFQRIPLVLQATNILSRRYRDVSCKFTSVTGSGEGVIVAALDNLPEFQQVRCGAVVVALTGLLGLGG
jgi:hypothetical protein